MIKTERVLGFVDLHSSLDFGKLNENRSYGTVTFLGRYALMDFALSNFTNSGIDKVCILSKNFIHSIRSHLRNGTPWIRNTKTGFQYILYNENVQASPIFNTSLGNIFANKTVFEDAKYDYVIFAPVNYAMAIDFRKVLDSHEASNCDITAVYLPFHEGKTKFLKSSLVSLTKEDEIDNFYPNQSTEDDVLISLETFVMSKKVLFDLIENTREENRSYGMKDAIRLLAKKLGYKIHGYCFDHFVLPVNDINEYITNSFKMLSYDGRRKMFRPEWPIYTTTHDTPPAKYLKSAKVSDSIISNGCIIEGTVEHSVLSRNVIVKKGAVVKNCIIFTGTVIEENAKLTNVVTDKHCLITHDKILSGTKSDPVLIKGGEKI